MKRVYLCGLALAWLMGSMTAMAALQVGAARVDQTGPMGPSQSGKYDHERVYARAIVIDNGDTSAVLISYEGVAGGFDMAATRKAIAAELDTGINNVVVTHTHTHSSAAMPNTGPNQIQNDGVSPTLLQAVRDAKGRLQPARVAYDEGASYLNVNRDVIDPKSRKWVQGSNLQAPVDRAVGVLMFSTPRGEPIAVWVNYAMHPINGYVLGFVSGDVPGAMSRYVEKAFGDTIIAAFSQGTSGDVNPLYLRLSNNTMASRLDKPISGYLMDRETYEGPLRAADAFGGKQAGAADPQALDQLFRFIESEGQLLGEEVIRVMSNDQQWEDDVRVAGSSISFACPGRQRTNGDPWDPATREGITGEYVDGPDQTLSVGLLGVGDTAVLTVNGEVYTAIGQRVKQAVPMNDTMIVTIANERVRGYIPDDASYGHQTFQVLNNFIKPGCAETGIADAAVKLEKEYLGEK